MEKKRYYVSVQAGTVMEHQGDAAYEFEIEATPDDVEVLGRLFAQKDSYDVDSFWRSHIPVIPYHIDTENDAHDKSLQEIYAMIYRLGTEETRQHIASMNLDFVDLGNEHRRLRSP
ncbi:hypothetical protein G3578_06920 [Brevibacillus sp. SYP-B805]|uniref:hypothetical protein n=1 Tax=Brevibacillus sp. SYP-B805 TaxID=1578199 RepID=UPI0013EB2BAF|nr:hypothetical protein [Brevibacillus sp. SYP-B805]NGQ94916.1 hypothetical protein [Brevibacillus sp. SYP-B805]